MLADGVYLGLPEAEYFGEDALGSTDLADLYTKRHGWWWGSKHNPDYQEKETEFQAFGSAFHKRLLEGGAAFGFAYWIGPNPRDYPDLIQGKDAIDQALGSVEGCPPRPKKATVATLLEWAEVYLPDAPIWERIVDQAKQSAGERTLLTWKDGRDIEAMMHTAMQEPDLKALFGEQVKTRLAEVSIFHTFTASNGQPVRCRFRFDSLFPQYSVDAKTVQDPTREFIDTVRWKTADWTLRLQAGWSYEMRAQAYKAIEEGRLFGGTKQQRALIKQFPARAPIDQVRWLWLFFQRPSDQGAAPMVLPIWLDRHAPEILQGEQAAWEAIDFYAQAVDTFGLDNFWYGTHPVMRGTDSDAGTGEFRLRTPARLPVINQE